MKKPTQQEYTEAAENIRRKPKTSIKLTAETKVCLAKLLRESWRETGGYSGLTENEREVLSPGAHAELESFIAETLGPLS